MNAEELLNRLINLDENEHIEAKRGAEIGSSVMETVCAFANEPGLGGGYLLLGVAREEMALFPSYEVVGVQNPDKLASDLASRCRTDFNMPVRVDIQSERMGGHNLLVVFVPEAESASKPLYFKNRGLPQGAFRRIGPTDQRCTEDDLTVLYAGRNGETYDYSIVPDATLEDLDGDAIGDYRRSRTEASPDAEELHWSDEDLLLSLGCLRRNNGQLCPTVAGILLFGKSASLRRLFPMMRIDYIRVPGKEWVVDPERRFDSVDMRDPLFRLIRRAQAAILDDLPKSFSLPEGELQRQDITPIPQRVLREAIVNAVMHRNYRVHSPIQIIRYSNRLEIRNPGFSLKPTEHLGEPGSLPRNPKIAEVLHETRFAETKGSGIRVMRDMMERARLTPPTFESDRVQDQFTARYLFHHFLGADDITWLSQFKDACLSDDEAKALIWVREVGAIDNASFRGLTRVDTLTASQKLRRLRDAGLLEQKGRGSATYYLPTKKLLGQGIVEAEARETEPLSHKPEGLSQMPEGLSQMPEGLSQMPEGLSQMSSLEATLSAEVRECVRNLGQRSSPEDVRNTILSLCKTQEWRAEDLAKLLRRDPAYVTRNYLAPMLVEGLLEYTVPESPRHPKQAYRASRK